LPLVNSTYRGYQLLQGQHLETLVPAVLRLVKPAPCKPVRINTPDDDFLDLDFYDCQSDQLVIISHGLEGNSQRPYMLGMAKLLVQQGYDVICWNFRACGEELNRQPRLYHSGATEDLDTVVNHALDRRQYNSIALAGFSLGGNLTVKYLGERGHNINSRIKAAVAFSVPLDLSAGSDRISAPGNWLYEKRFLKKLKAKIRAKRTQFPEHFRLNGLDNIKVLRDFDDQYTARLHGFRGADDYYSRCSSINFIATVATPTLIINAKNDPFLPSECYPYELMKEHEFIHFETPERGGHVGFFTLNNSGIYWSDQRALEFIRMHMNNTNLL
jgi:predicted alpha/beta-fold hydrolase